MMRFGMQPADNGLRYRRQSRLWARNAAIRSAGERTGRRSQPARRPERVTLEVRAPRWLPARSAAVARARNRMPARTEADSLRVRTVPQLAGHATGLLPAALRAL